MIGRYAEVRGSLFDHLQNGMQYPDDGAERLVFALGEVAPAVELAEQLVRAVHEMDDQRACRVSNGRALGTGRSRCPRDRGILP